MLYMVQFSELLRYNMILHGSAVQLRMKYDLEGFYNLHVQLRVNTIFYGRQYSVQLRDNAILYGATVQLRDNVIWYSTGIDVYDLSGLTLIQ